MKEPARCCGVIWMDSVPYCCQYETGHAMEHAHAVLIHLNKAYSLYTKLEWGHARPGNLVGKTFHAEWSYSLEAPTEQ